MAVLQKIRVKFGLVISIIIALALLSFIIDPTTLDSALQTMSSKYDVGEINGKSISYDDFLKEVENYTVVNEVMTGSSIRDEETQQTIRDAAWQSLLNEHLFVKNAKDAGIRVGEAEMLALTTGEMISPVLYQNVAFADETGVFNPDYLIQFVQSLSTDQTGVYRTYWNYLQNAIYTQQFYTKYGALFTYGNIESPALLNRTIAENNNTAEVNFVMQPLSYLADSTLTVSDSEIKAYYKEHKDMFKQQASRDIEYVVYEVVPSAEDVAEVGEEVSRLYEEFTTTDNMKNFLTKNSDRVLSDYWYKDGELSTYNEDVDAFVSEAKKGEFSQIFQDGNTFVVAKIMEEARVADSVYVKHILLQGTDSQKVADSLLAVINGRNAPDFAELAAQYSADQSSDGTAAGNIGWMTQTYMIPGLESVITAPLNKAYIQKTQYGTHVVMVTDRTALMPKKQVALYEKTTLASKETFNEYYSKANTLATLAAGNYDDYKAAVDTLGVYSHALNVLESTSSYGSIDNAKEVTRWVFDNKLGKVSNIITVDNNYFFIAAVKGVHEEGYATVQEAAAAIRNQIFTEKIAVKQAEEVAKQVEGLTDLNAIAEKLGTTVSTQSDVTFSSSSTMGMDPKLIGAIASAPENVVCGPIAGLYAVYYFEVTGRDTGAFYTEDDAKNLLDQKNQYNSQMILSVMMEDVDVVDHRARFF